MSFNAGIDDPTSAARYLSDQLTPGERADYERRLLEDPDAVAELEATARLKIGLERLRRSGELDALIASPAPYNRPLLLGMAASIAAVVIGVSLWFPLSRHPSPVLASAATALVDSSGHSLAVAVTAPLFRTRAQSYDAVIELPARRAAIRLRALPGTLIEGATYEASLSQIGHDSRERVASVGNLKPSIEDGFVDLYADSTSLTPGRYRLILRQSSGGTTAAESDTFVVKVTAGAP